MSRFFRSNASSDSESSSEDGDDADEITADVSSNAALNPPNSDAVDRPAINWNLDHRDFLLHALLEERCMTEALATHDNQAHRRPSRDSPDVQAEAKAKYQRLCAQLAPFNLISTGLDADHHAVTRQRYRQGLDYLGRQGSTPAVPPTFKRLLTDTEGSFERRHNGDSTGDARRESMKGLSQLSYPLRRLLTDAKTIEQRPYQNRLLQSTPAFNHALRGPMNQGLGSNSMIESRYHSDFEELSTLGRGGYGVVYSVKHRLDNQVYAVKKVPLNTARLRKIQENGVSEVDEILRELRTLARLDHPNIVRYYTGWLELVDPLQSTVFQSSKTEGQSVGDRVSESAAVGAEDYDSESIQRIVTESETLESDIVFEHSHQSLFSTVHEPASNELQDSDAGLSLRRIGTKSTLATVSDDTIETVDRDIEPTASVQSGPDEPPFTEPSLVLHIQMSLHPMTLADLVSPVSPHNGNSGNTPPLVHCHHLEPSIAILTATLDGIEHLHKEGIVHRDLKPANIFLSPTTTSRTPPGAVNLQPCSDCCAEGTSNHIALEVRIGDFGLVTLANSEPGAAPASAAVGTELYRPATSSAHSPSLDIYALGVIAFELCWKFNTRMERLHCIQQLKQGEFPTGFAERLGKPDHGEKMMECIRAMISRNGETVTIPDIKDMLIAIQSNDG